MANTASRLSANGSLTISGSFDELTFNPTANVAINLFNYTQDFTNAYWNKRLTITSTNELAPDNSLTATLFTYNLQFALVQTQTTFTNTFGRTYTFSCYVKATTTQVALVTTTAYCNYNVSNGTVGGGNAFIAATITRELNGFYRCSLTFTSNSSTEGFGIWLAGFTGGVFTGQTMTVWGPQVELASNTTIYQPKGAGTILANVTNKLSSTSSNNATLYIRGEYDEVTYNPNANVRVNLISYSQEINNVVFGTSWSAIGSITASPSTVLSPDNKTTAYKLVLGNGVALNSAAWGQNPVKIRAADDTYTFSIYAKVGERNTIRMMIRDSANINNLIESTINLSSKSVNSSIALGFFKNANTTINDVGNGWLRISLTGTTWFESGLRIQMYSYDSVATTGDGTSGIYIWGAQFEQNSNSTIYVPTASLQTGANTIIANTFNQRTVNTGNTYIRGTYDEYSKMSPITEGLIFNIDPGYDVSYIGSGATMYDTTQNKYVVNLAAGTAPPTYSNDFGGILKFTSLGGNNAWANTNIPSNIITTTSNYTMSAWIRFNRSIIGTAELNYRLAGAPFSVVTPQANTGFSYGAAGTILGTNFFGNYGLYWLASMPGPSGVKNLAVAFQNRINSPSTQEASPGSFSNIINDNLTYFNWTHIAGVYNSSANFAGFYVNGVLVNSTTTSQITVGSFPYTISTIRIGQNIVSGGSALDRTFDGDIGPMCIWNRALANTEVQQIFNSQRSRFGV